MAGGYENEDRQAELEELRREKEREARERLEAERRSQGLRRDNAPGPGELAHPDDHEEDEGRLADKPEPR
ncbi:MAG TPA: hypothetical protein VHI93_00080 [Candidatus Thermoplasmatota archaeon]|nr:hypothetical protein [Candidatus Thermoplasmatota archaeon]